MVRSCNRDKHDTAIVGVRSDGYCRGCSREDSRNWYFSNKKRVQEYSKYWYSQNMERIKKRSISPEFKEYRWKRNGIKNPDGSFFTSVDFDRAYQIQQGCCKICKKHQSSFAVSLSVDHKHSNGIFRALLCFSCNAKVGIVESKDYPNILGYLKDHG